MNTLRNRIPRLAPLALAFAAALALPAQAADDDASRRKALDQARAELQAAARRVAELSRELGAREAAAFAPPAADARPRLGVLLGSDDQAGVRIVGVTPGSGADKAGLKAGDRLLRVRGQAIAGGTAAQRVASAREALARLEPGKPVRLGYQRDGRQHEVEVTPATVRPLVFARTLGGDGRLAAVLDAQDLAPLKDLGELGPQIRSEVLRLGRPDCGRDGCAAPLLSEALRWDGLNLAALDAQLGRYFGTDRGVLVLSQGTLPGLQAGDVIQKIEGRPVASPRDALRAMRAKKAGEQARVTVLRDRAARDVL
ncbi:MAG TPA: PDZ domain-containing protein, partial [Pseudoxanthomonas sp.]|nr:PDZ domain-containing protein [Pseudoxanthomonas sp.]